MDYTIKAIETTYKGFLFRSRLEAKWAAMFDLLGWNWDYEPIDFSGWIPDFVIYGVNPIYVEVKPVIEFPEDVAKEIDKSGCKDECLIVGQSIHPRGANWDDVSFGWLRENQYMEICQSCGPDDWECNCETPNIAIKDVGYGWEEAVFGKWKKSKTIGFCHAYGDYTDRISGGYDGGSFGGITLNKNEVDALWARAHNATRWNKK